MAVFTTLAIGGLTGAALIGAGTAVYGLGIAAAGTIKSAKAAKAAAAASRAAVDTQIKQQQQQAARERRSAVRQGVITRARALQAANARGAAFSSAVSGGTSSLSSQFGTNVGYGTMMSGLGQRLTSQTGQAAQYNADSQRYSAYAGFGMQLFGASGQLGNLAGSFGGMSAGEKAFGTGSDYLTSAAAG